MIFLKNCFWFHGVFFLYNFLFNFIDFCFIFIISLLLLALDLFCSSFSRLLRKMLGWDLRPFFFRIAAVRVINSPLCTLQLHPTSFNVFPFTSKYFLIFLKASSLTHRLFISVLIFEPSLGWQRPFQSCAALCEFSTARNAELRKLFGAGSRSSRRGLLTPRGEEVFLSPFSLAPCPKRSQGSSNGRVFSPPGGADIPSQSEENPHALFLLLFLEKERETSICRCTYAFIGCFL